VQARNLKEDRHLDALRQVELIEEEACRVVGTSGVAFLAGILRDGLTFTEVAARAAARGSRADVSKVGDRFRWLLEQLADGWSAKVAEQPTSSSSSKRAAHACSSQESHVQQIRGRHDGAPLFEEIGAVRLLRPQRSSSFHFLRNRPGPPSPNSGMRRPWSSGPEDQGRLRTRGLKRPVA
jgi:hypothetical protein